MEQIEAKRKERVARYWERKRLKKKKQEERIVLCHRIKKNILMGMLGIAALSGGMYGIKCVSRAWENHQRLRKQEEVHTLISRVSPDRALEIRKKYDMELYSLIEAYHYGEKLNGMIWSPKNAVFAAHSHLLSKYNAYDPDAFNEKLTPEDWVLLDHMCYRYYQYRQMNLSNKMRDRKNPYLDMLRMEIDNPTAVRMFVRHDNLFEGLKLKRVLER